MNRIVLVKTCQRFRHRREACVDTWVGEIDRALSDIRVYFIEGGHRERGLHETYHRRNDGNGWSQCVRVFQSTCRDDYNGNSYKLRDGLRALLNAEPDCSHVFICDDDTFVHPQRWLDYQPEAEFVGLCSEEMPHVHGGAGWYMSRRACQLYIDNIRQRWSGDDVSAWQICRDHGIPLVNRPDLFSQWTDRVSADNRLITCHEVGATEMEVLYASL